MATPPNAGHFVEFAVAPALCESDRVPPRATAARLLAGQLAVPAILYPDVSTATAPGRVFSAGRFRNDAVRQALISAIGPKLSSFLREEFEWYACRGAFFHNDAHFVDVLFGAWCVAGPTREVVFSRAQARATAGPGSWVIFDPFEPHAVLDTGQNCYERDRYLNAVPSIFVGFELTLDEPIREHFGIVGQPAQHAAVLSSAVAINAETGTLA